MFGGDILDKITEISMVSECDQLRTHIKKKYRDKGFSDPLEAFAYEIGVKPKTLNIYLSGGTLNRKREKFIATLEDKFSNPITALLKSKQAQLDEYILYFYRNRYLYTEDIDYAVFHQLENIAEEHGNFRQQLFVRVLIAIFRFLRGQITESHIMFQRILKEEALKNYTELEIICRTEYAFVLLPNGIQQAQKIILELAGHWYFSKGCGTESLICFRYYYVLGMIARLKLQWETAIFNFELANNFISDNLIKSFMHYNIGFSCVEIRMIRPLKEFVKAEKLLADYPDSFFKAFVYDHIAYYYEKNSNDHKADKYIKQIISILEQSDFSNLSQIHCNFISESFRASGELPFLVLGKRNSKIDTLKAQRNNLLKCLQRMFIDSIINDNKALTNILRSFLEITTDLEAFKNIKEDSFNIVLSSWRRRYE